MFETDQSPLLSTKLISLDKHFDEMVKLYNTGSFPKVLLLNGKKGLGKFTLAFHFLNYVYSNKEKKTYNTLDKEIDSNSTFYNSILNQTNTDVIFLQAETGKNIKIDDVRNLKSVLSKSSLSYNPRFTIIDEVEFLNSSSVNALLKTLEEPSDNNYFILINNQQAELIETVSSRCLKSNIYLNLEQRKKVIEHFIESKKIDIKINNSDNLTPGLFFRYNELCNKLDLNFDDDILPKLKKLLQAFKKDKNKSLINMSFFFIDQFFYELICENKDKINILLNLKSNIVNKINDFIKYNLNINSVLGSIEAKIIDAKQ